MTWRSGVQCPVVDLVFLTFSHVHSHIYLLSWLLNPLGFMWKTMPVGVIPCHLHHLASIFLDLSSIFLCIYEVICKRKTRLLTHHLKTPFLLFSACRLIHFFKMTFLFLIFPCSVSPLLFLKFMFFKLYFPWECLFVFTSQSFPFSFSSHPPPPMDISQPLYVKLQWD